ncbi:hypothetical protein P74p79 [Thermus phage P74-26]|uniref:Uncharacterized protein n=1 Tax=Thermus phage P74-26 TaxID=2914007 RepID=A7XXQ5_BP742|nr:hypothetical protein P74p79 [Thermus phage P74-26]ABU97029.1 hypothetical protein P74p79 [Thermus phage P74-26]
MNAREAIAAGLRFYQRVGRAPRREDFRPKHKARWEAILGFELPGEYTIKKEFGGFNNYIRAMGLSLNVANDVEEVENASLRHVLEVYPNAQLVKSEQSVYDLEIGQERVEVKGTQLSIRNDNGAMHFSWRLHNRIFSKLVDRVILVGLDKDLNPLVRLEFKGSGLRLLDDKDTLTVYADALLGGHSKYKPYITWIAPIAGDLSQYARVSKARL